MKITIPEHSVLGIYINGSVIGVVKEPTLDIILKAVSEELAVEQVTPTKPIDDMNFEWFSSKYDFEVWVDDEENNNTETIELMPIVLY